MSTYLSMIKKEPPYTRFLYYINERNKIRKLRAAGEPREHWTADPIFREFKFTNVKRDWDFTSTWLWKNWYEPHRHEEAVGIAAVFARFFCLVPTLQAVGYPKSRPGNLPSKDVIFWLSRSEAILKLRAQRGEKVFTSAYMIAGGGSAGRSKIEWVINDIIRPVHESRVLRSAWPHTINDLHNRLREFNGFGDFMTQEVVLDLMKTFVLMNRPQDEHLVYGFAGPGALRGLNRVFGRGVKERGTNRTTAQGEMILLWEKVRRDLQDRTLRASLTVHDIEFNLCEFDKYERALWGQGTPKQKFIPRDSAGEGMLL